LSCIKNTSLSYAVLLGQPPWKMDWELIIGETYISTQEYNYSWRINSLLYPKELFITLEEHRDKQLNKLL